MRILKLTNRSLIPTALVTLLLVLPSCSVNVKKNADESEKKVDISTPVGAIHVGENADLKSIGLSVYPGSRPKKKEHDGDEKGANVNISTGFFGLKVVAQEFESDDAPEKVIPYYSKELRKYGKVIQCHKPWQDAPDVNIETDKDKSDKESQELTCDSGDKGNATELKAGTKDNQHLVAVAPEGKGSKFALVFVQVRGKEGTI